jgi:hypothetical protein
MAPPQPNWKEKDKPEETGTLDAGTPEVAKTEAPEGNAPETNGGKE